MKAVAIPATSTDPGPVVEFVEGQIAQYDCSSKTLYQLEVVIEEVFVNIVSYGGLSESDSVEVRCDVLTDPLRLVLQFLDNGVPFNPLAADDPDITPDGLMSREGGLGIFMVKKMMDEVAYDYEDGKNKLTIVKNLP